MSSHRIMGGNIVGLVRESNSLFNTASHEEQCPPAYSEASSVTDFSQTCCAYEEAIEHNLHRYQSFDFIVRDLSAYRCLAQESQRLLFLYWVAYCCSSSVSTSKAGRVRCPLVGCREAFEDHKELVDHVGKCPHLAQGEYYCPYHKREERFAEPTTVEIAAVTSNTSRKHFLKGAINAIRRGSRSIRNAINTTRSTTQRQALVPTQQNAQDKMIDEREMSDTMPRPNTHELEGQQFAQMISRTTASYILELPECQRFEMEAATSRPAELESPLCPSMDWSSSTSSTYESMPSPMSPVSPVDRSFMRWSEDTWSPVSPTDTINMFSDFISPAQLIKPTEYQKGPTSSHQFYELGATPVPPTFGTITAFMLPNLQEHIYAPKHKIVAVRDHRMLEYNTIAESSGLMGIQNNFGVVEHTDAQPSNTQELFQQDLGFDGVATANANELGQNQRLKEIVINEILLASGLEKFRTMVMDVEKLLDAPRIVSPKELQEELVNSAIPCATSPEVLQTFTILVNYLCEMAELSLFMEQPVGEDYDLHNFDPLQHGHYSTEQDGYPYTDQQQQVHSGTTSSSYSPPRTVTGLSELPDNLVSTRMFAENITLSQGTNSGFQTGYSSPRDKDLHTSLSNIPDIPELGDNFVDDHPNANPPTTRRQLAAADSASSTFPPGRGSVTCPQCGEVLKGKLEWLPSNLQRHLREKHTAGKRFPCPIHACPKDFSRKSNLQVHLNTVHRGMSGR